MIKQEQITLTLARKTIKSIDSYAAAKGVSREQLVIEMFNEYERRERVRNKIHEIARRKQSNRLRLKTALEKMPDSKLSEKELDRDIEIAIKAVRKQRRSHAKPIYSRS